MSAGRKPEDMDAGPGISETGYGLGPVHLVAVGLTPDLAELLPVGAQAWAAGAADDGLMDRLKDGER